MGFLHWWFPMTCHGVKPKIKKFLNLHRSLRENGLWRCFTLRQIMFQRLYEEDNIQKAEKNLAYAPSGFIVQLVLQFPYLLLNNAQFLCVNKFSIFLRGKQLCYFNFILECTFFSCFLGFKLTPVAHFAYITPFHSPSMEQYDFLSLGALNKGQ